MKPDIEMVLIAAKPDGRGDTVFVARTMRAVADAKSTQVMGQVLANNTPLRRRGPLARFKQLPVGLLIALVALAMLTLGGTAYAAYRLWLSPEARVESVGSKYGRSQALIALKNCRQENEKITTEITPGSGGSADDAAKILVAHCELEAIMQWSHEAFVGDPSAVLLAFTVVDVGRDSLVITSDEVPSRTIKVAQDTPVIYRGETGKLSSLRQGDAVAYVSSNRDPSMVLAVVKLSYPVSYYNSPKAFNSYHERLECEGSPGESCVNLPSADVLHVGEGGANKLQGEMRRIQGTLTEHTPTYFKLRATSGTNYTVYTATDVIAEHNNTKFTCPLTVEPGDVLEVRYSYASSEQRQVIAATEYHSIGLLLQRIDKKSGCPGDADKYRYDKL